MQRRIIRVFGLSLMAGQLLECVSEGFVPGALIDGVYVVQKVDGEAFPATIAKGGGQHYILLADTMRFLPQGMVARTVVYRHSSTDMFPRDSVYRIHVSFPYVLDGRRVTIGNRRPCPPNAQCIGSEEGMIGAYRVVIVARLFWSGEPVLDFRRIQTTIALDWAGQTD